MNKWIGILTLVLLVGVLQFGSQYHLTVGGSWSELEHKWDGEVVAPYSKEDGMAILLDKKGNLYIGMAYHTDVLVFYHDFTIYPTNLNVYNVPKDNEYYTSKVRGYGANYEMYIGMISDSKVKNTLTNSKTLETINLFSLEKQVSSDLKQQLKEIKIFNSSYKITDELIFTVNNKRMTLKPVYKG